MKVRQQSIIDAACIWGMVALCVLVFLILVGIPFGVAC